ncbi:MAG TPA: transcription termination/antitermination NusG family protein [Tepidisphaeraceae bacterium]|jgi:transcription antitermination factor NusG|nr:transcription termination/antitermination NusG family protein [Tepidisphaeraceae bacterium]
MLVIPENLLEVSEFVDHVARTDGQQASWFVLHTKSRQEKRLAEELCAGGISHFLPQLQLTRRYGDRRAIVNVPLFPGYLFLRGTVEDAYRAERTRRVAKIIPVRDQQRISWELRNISLALAYHAVLEPYHALQRGIRVQVVAGPFMGLEGVIEERKSDRLVLQVEMLGRAVSLEVDGAVLEPIE